MIRHILFDLDCTLYSVHYGLEENVLRRIREYIFTRVDLPPEEGELLWRDGVKRYGTTIEWLITERSFTAIADYYAYIHPENEAETLPRDPELRNFLENLPCPCSILTNSPGFHTERIIKKLGLEGIFQRIFDMETNAFKGKPSASAFHRALDELALKPEEVFFIDDAPRNVDAYLALGGKGVLLDERDVHKDFPHERIRTLREITRFLN